MVRGYGYGCAFTAHCVCYIHVPPTHTVLVYLATPVYHSCRLVTPVAGYLRALVPHTHTVTHTHVHGSATGYGYAHGYAHTLRLRFRWLRTHVHTFCRGYVRGLVGSFTRLRGHWFTFRFTVHLLPRLRLLHVYVYLRFTLRFVAVTTTHTRAVGWIAVGLRTAGYCGFYGSYLRFGCSQFCLPATHYGSTIAFGYRLVTGSRFTSHLRTVTPHCLRLRLHLHTFVRYARLRGCHACVGYGYLHRGSVGYYGSYRFYAHYAHTLPRVLRTLRLVWLYGYTRSLRLYAHHARGCALHTHATRTRVTHRAHGYCRTHRTHTRRIFLPFATRSHTAAPTPSLVTVCCYARLRLPPRGYRGLCMRLHARLHWLHVYRSYTLRGCCGCSSPFWLVGWFTRLLDYMVGSPDTFGSGYRTTVTGLRVCGYHGLRLHAVHATFAVTHCGCGCLHRLVTLVCTVTRTLRFAYGSTHGYHGLRIPRTGWFTVYILRFTRMVLVTLPVTAVTVTPRSAVGSTVIQFYGLCPAVYLVRLRLPYLPHAGSHTTLVAATTHHAVTTTRFLVAVTAYRTVGSRLDYVAYGWMRLGYGLRLRSRLRLFYTRFICHYGCYVTVTFTTTPGWLPRRLRFTVAAVYCRTRTAHCGSAVVTCATYLPATGYLLLYHTRSACRLHYCLVAACLRLRILPLRCRAAPHGSTPVIRRICLRIVYLLRFPVYLAHCRFAACAPRTLVVLRRTHLPACAGSPSAFVFCHLPGWFVTPVLQLHISPTRVCGYTAAFLHFAWFCAAVRCYTQVPRSSTAYGYCGYRLVRTVGYACLPHARLRLRTHAHSCRTFAIPLGYAVLCVTLCRVHWLYALRFAVRLRLLDFGYAHCLLTPHLPLRTRLFVLVRFPVVDSAVRICCVHTLRFCRGLRTHTVAHHAHTRLYRYRPSQFWITHTYLFVTHICGSPRFAYVALRALLPSIHATCGCRSCPTPATPVPHTFTTYHHSVVTHLHLHCCSSGSYTHRLQVAHRTARLPLYRLRHGYARGSFTVTAHRSGSTLPPRYILPLPTCRTVYGCYCLRFALLPCLVPRLRCVTTTHTARVTHCRLVATMPVRRGYQFALHTALVTCGSPAVLLVLLPAAHTWLVLHRCYARGYTVATVTFIYAFCLPFGYTRSTHLRFTAVWLHLLPACVRVPHTCVATHTFSRAHLLVHTSFLRLRCRLFCRGLHVAATFLPLPVCLVLRVCGCTVACTTVAYTRSTVYTRTYRYPSTVCTLRYRTLDYAAARFTIAVRSGLCHRCYCRLRFVRSAVRCRIRCRTVRAVYARFTFVRFTYRTTRLRHTRGLRTATTCLRFVCRTPHLPVRTRHAVLRCTFYGLPTVWLRTAVHLPHTAAYYHCAAFYRLRSRLHLRFCAHAHFRRAAAGYRIPVTLFSSTPVLRSACIPGLPVLPGYHGLLYLCGCVHTPFGLRLPHTLTLHTFHTRCTVRLYAPRFTARTRTATLPRTPHALPFGYTFCYAVLRILHTVAVFMHHTVLRFVLPHGSYTAFTRGLYLRLVRLHLVCPHCWFWFWLDRFYRYYAFGCRITFYGCCYGCLDYVGLPHTVGSPRFSISFWTLPTFTRWLPAVTRWYYRILCALPGYRPS